MTHGRLVGAESAPLRGETTVPVVVTDAFTVEQILSGRLDGPQEYLQDHDEWVVVLGGVAMLVVDGVEHVVEPGDWWLLPAGTPHRLLRTDPGTTWLAVRGRGAGD